MERYEHNTKRTRRIEAVQTVLAHMARQIVHTPIDASSDHYRTPEEIAADNQPELPLSSGWDSEGNYHDPTLRIERTDISQLGNTRSI